MISFPLSTGETAEALGLRLTGVEQQRVNVFGGGVERFSMKKSLCDAQKL
jgi:hypothetical protein